MLERTTPSKLFSSSCQIVEARNPKEAAELKEQDEKGDEEAQNSVVAAALAHQLISLPALRRQTLTRLLDSTRLDSNSFVPKLAS